MLAGDDNEPGSAVGPLPWETADHLVAIERITLRFRSRPPVRLA